MPHYLRMLLRGQKVWVKVGEDGHPEADKTGRVEIRYRLEDLRSYRAAVRNLEPIPGTEKVEHTPPRSVETAVTLRSPTPRAHRASVASRAPLSPERRGLVTRDMPPGGAPPDDPEAEPPIVIYTDGACTGNPGPMGIGVVLVAGDRRKELSEYLGRGTNNIAELTAILRGLEAVLDRERPVRLYSDSSYAIGVLSGGWKAKANRELIERIRTIAATFDDLQLVKVAGHAGVPENERCDELARAAIVSGSLDH